MRDLNTSFTIGNGNPVSGVSAAGNIISVGYCGNAIELFDRGTGSHLSTSTLGGLCDLIESGFYRDTLRVIGFPTTIGIDAFIQSNHDANGKRISTRQVDSSLIFNPLIRVSESGGYFVTSDKGHVYSFDGKYVGQLKAGDGSFRDFAFSTDGSTIYALYVNGNIQKMSYPSLQKVGNIYLMEDDVKWATERLFVDEKYLVRIFNVASSSSATEIRLKVVPLSKIGR
jgi:hypothetical protein